jgi:hypothetical protein
MKRITTLLAATALGIGLIAAPALAEHPHTLTTPGGCVDGAGGLGAGQPHAPGDEWAPGQGRYLHSGLHMGATGEDNATLGKGNSRVTITGGATCDG